MTLKETIQKLRLLANPDKVAFKQSKFGIVSTNALGIYHADLKVLAREIGHNSDLGFQLVDSNIYEARLLGSKILKPKDISSEDAEKWVSTFSNWEICDSFCMGLFSKTGFAEAKIVEWANRESEFEKRAAFATLSSFCMANKKASNEVFESFLPLLINASKDERLYVKKAVNWALRSIGKRNMDLHQKALETANVILKINSKSAKWIALDAIKQLSLPKVNVLDYPRSIYRP